VLDQLDRGREAFDRGSWNEAYAQLSAADGQAGLDCDDLERLAACAYLTGRLHESTELWTRAHQRCVQTGDGVRAARCAFWVAFELLNAGELARGGGWLERGQRLISADSRDCVEQGYLRYCAGLRAVFEGEVSTAGAAFAEAAKVGSHFGDQQLVALARVGEGRCLIYLGDIAEGIVLLDEAMVAVTAGEVSPPVVGDLYCTVIEGCQEVFDVRRAHEWTSALSHWCDTQPELVLYRGQCLAHRAELMVLRGEWGDAETEAERAIERLGEVSPRALGTAFYASGELRRLRGDFGGAEEAYRQANECGRQPQPGMALLRLARGDADAAAAMIRRVCDEAEDAVTRTGVLPACVEILLAAGDVVGARLVTEELAGIAVERSSLFIRAQAARATGSVLLAEGDTPAAVAALRRAWAAWRDLEARYEAARTRVLLALASRAAADEDGALLELDAARAVFEQLGAAPELARVEELAGIGSPAPGGLTAREREVLAEVARGQSNRAIAAELVIGERTVATHVSSILTKLGLPSRTAAAAYAYEHGLV
jgi:DNA-binding NarL/FixJ family response regulator